MFLAALALLCTFRAVEPSTTPKQIHLSYGDSAAKTIVVTWSTLDPVQASAVHYGQCAASACSSSTPLTQTVQATVTKFVDGGLAKSVQYIHRAVLTDLLPNQKYAYRINVTGAQSEVLHFPTPGGSDWVPRIAVFGDLGINLATVPAMTAEVKSGLYDAIVGVGDYAYDLGTDNGTYGDNFMNDIQPFASLVPLMLCPGNHEDMYNFSHWINRFSMPNHKETDNMFYSFNLGPIHFVSISTEYYFYPEFYTNEHTKRQFDWIAQDLADANSEANRKERPFIIVMQHKPMYCTEAISTPDTGYSLDCTVRAALLREGNVSMPFGLEELYHKHKVDLVFAGHVHYYERMHPVYKQVANPPADLHVYKNPEAAIQVITGTAGNPYGLQNFSEPKDFKAVGVTDRYSYGKLVAWNKTHLSFEQVAVLESDSAKTESIDNFWIIKSVPDSASLHSYPYAVLLMGIFLALIHK